jgi:PAS domain S-box-containing protein
MLSLLSGASANAQLVACSRLVGQRFCDAVVQALAEALGIPTVLIARYNPNRSGWARTVAVWTKGALVPAFDYDLAGSPCHEVMKDGTCHFANNVAQRFPKDVLLTEMGAEGYLGVPLFNHGGRAVGVLAAISETPLDISDTALSLIEIFASRVAAELDREASISRSEYLGRLIDGSAGEVYVFDAQSLRFVLVNESARLNLGYSTEELEQMTPVDLKPDFSREQFLNLLRPLQTGDESTINFRTRHLRRDGTSYVVEVNLRQLGNGGDTVFFAAIEDISERASVEDKLHHAETRLQRIFSQSPAGIIEADATGRITLVNPAFRSMLDYSEAELLEKTIFDLTHPDSMPQTLAAVEQLKAGDEGVIVEKNYVRRNGSSASALSNVSALRAENGEFIGVAAIVTDVTQRLEAEVRLRESEARLRKILDGTLAFVGVLRLDGTLLEANTTALAAADLARADVIGKKFWECDWWSHDPAVALKLQEAVARAAAGEVVRYDEVIRIRDNGRLTIDFMLTPYTAEDGTIQLLVPSGVDITERKKQEAMLRELMREVNHRSKNLLSVVQAIARQMPEVEPKIYKRELGLRLQSLAASQDILVNSGWQRVQMSAVLLSQLEHFQNLVGKRIFLSGPDLMVTPAATQAFSMAVYELTTNATKYGALSNDSGIVELSWHIAHEESSPRLHFNWQERGGPEVAQPSRAGFGSKVLMHLVPGLVNGKSTATYDPAGFEWHFDCHLEAFQRS